MTTQSHRQSLPVKRRHRLVRARAPSRPREREPARRTRSRNHELCASTVARLLGRHVGHARFDGRLRPDRCSHGDGARHKRPCGNSVRSRSVRKASAAHPKASRRRVHAFHVTLESAHLECGRPLSRILPHQSKGALVWMEVTQRRTTNHRLRTAIGECHRLSV